MCQYTTYGIRRRTVESVYWVGQDPVNMRNVVTSYKEVR